MASHVDVSTELANIASAIYGKDVRGSIHDGIQKIANAVNGAIDTQLLTVDGSLTQQGAGADAAIVGAMFSQIQDSIDAQAGIDRIAAISVGSDATEIASGTNLNSITVFGIYVSKSQAISASLINCPISDNSFVMYVERVAGATAAFIQRIIPYHPERCDEWTRIYSSTHGTWGEWIETGDAEGRAYGKYAKPVAVNTDLNDYTTPGVYVRDSADGYSIGHDPVNNTVEDTHYSYMLYVERIAPSKTAVRQRVVVYSIFEPQEWVRIFTGSTWTEWIKNPSRKDLDNIQNEIENLNVETDKTLKVADKPADSQAVGQALKKIPLQDIVGVNRFPDNLVVIDDCVLNSKVNPSTGAFQSDISYFRTGYMSVTPGVSYKANHGRDLAWYDNNKGFISGVSGVTVQSGVTAPNNARFAAFSVHKLNDGISTNAAYLYFAETTSYDEKTTIDGLDVDTETDKTLSIVDKPADSKTVGDALTVVRSNFADEFSTSTAYAIGDIVLYQGQLYKFKAAHAAGAWNAAHVDPVTVDSEIGEVKDALDNIDVETDTTLSVAGKPADAKAVGDVINPLGQTTVALEYTTVPDAWVTSAGAIQTHSGWSRTDYIDLTDVIRFKTNINTNYASYFDKDKNPKAPISVRNGVYDDVPEGATYAMVSQTTTAMSSLVITAVKIGMIEKIENDIKEVKESLDNISVITDTTLSESGKAADAKVVGDTFSESLIIKTVTGNPATFSDGVKGFKIKNLIAHINPIQTGDGDPSPTNVRPISGFTGVTVNVSGDDTSDYTPYVVDWSEAAGTVYGGYYDLISGILTVTHVAVDMSTLNWSKPNNASYFQVVIATSNPGGSGKIANAYCDSYKIITSKGVTDASFVDGTIFNWNAGYFYLKNTEYSDATSLKASLTGKYLVYELKTAQTYQLTSQQVLAAEGENNFWSNCNGDTDVSYSANTELWVLGKLSEIEDEIHNIMPLFEKKITLIGDSITAQTGRARVTHGKWLSDWSGCVVQNLGISGTGFKRNTNYIYINRINQINSDVDIIGVAASFNDMIFDLGTATDTTSDDTVCGYANDFFDALITAFPTKRIVCYSEGPWESYRPGITKSDEYMSLMKTICENKGIVWDDGLYRGCALRPWLQANREVYYVGEYGDLDGVVDNVHPNSAGQKVIARFLEKLFEKVVDD